MDARPSIRRKRIVAVLAAALAALAAAVALPAGAGANPGDFSQAQVDQAIINGVNYVSSVQDPTDGHIDTTGGGFPQAETGLGIISYGVLDQGHTANLNPGQQALLTKAVDWLLGQQSSDGSFGGSTGLDSYSTGIALLALSYVGDLQAPGRDVAGAIAKGRNYLISQQNAPPSVTGNAGSPDCSSNPADGNFAPYCGGWNYSANSFGRSDESNTGFALTGLAASGGVPGPTAAVDLGWQRNVQELAGNPGNPGARNDGGGSYEPGIHNGDFSSNANDTGSNIFSYAYDGTPVGDPGVQAAIRFGNTVLDVYEMNKGTIRTMVYHSANDFEGPCVIGASGCNWQSGAGEGGYHYSMFALSKGLGQYGPSDLKDPNNFYAKVVDLLLGEQNPDGSWPFDSRDDGSQLGATAFAIMSLGRVGQPPIVQGTVFNDLNGNGLRARPRADNDPGLAGGTVFVDVNGNGVRDAGEPSSTSAADGSYSVQNIPEGTFNLIELPPSGFVCTAPTGCVYPSEQFKLGTTLTRDFGNLVPPISAAASRKPIVCVSTRRFVIHVQRARRYHLVSASVFVNGKRVKVRRRSSRRHPFTAIVDLRNLKAGTYHVLVVGRSKSGKVRRFTRTYHTCAAKRPGGHPKL